MCVFGGLAGYIGVQQWVPGINEVECEQCSCQPSASERAQITGDLLSTIQALKPS